MLRGLGRRPIFSKFFKQNEDEGKWRDIVTVSISWDDNTARLMNLDGEWFNLSGVRMLATRGDLPFIDEISGDVVSHTILFQRPGCVVIQQGGDLLIGGSY